ncbi:MarR family winged helix-turn-helix transcriptional regulator [Antarctobacter heliothermus]|nr:MarR family transcriptional regulator [Antarctobacter heliothermus]
MTLPGLKEVRQSPGYLIRRAHQQATAAYVAELGSGQITGVQFVALVAVAEEGGLSGTVVADRIGYDKMTTSHVLRRLERKALIERRTSLTDRRETLIFATPAGREIVAEVNERLGAVSEKLFRGLDPVEATTLLTILSKMETLARRG